MERKEEKLNLAPRTKPLESRHLNPGQENQEEPKDPKQRHDEEQQDEEVKNEVKQEEKIEEERPKSKENPFGNATPVQTTYKEREQQFVEKKPPRENNTKRDQGRNFQKNNRNPWPKQQNKDSYEEPVQREQGSSNWSFRGGRNKNNFKRGGQRPNNYNLRKDETQQGGQDAPVSNNMYEALFEGNVDDVNENNEELNESKE